MRAAGTTLVGTSAERAGLIGRPGQLYFESDTLLLYAYDEVQGWLLHNLNIGSTAISISVFQVVLYHLGSVVTYPATDIGLAAALLAAVKDDAVWLPIGSISGDHVVPADISLYGHGYSVSELTGKLTLYGACSLADFSMVITESSASNVIAITGPTTGGDVLVNNLSIDVNNSGAGNAIVYYLQDTAGNSFLAENTHFHPIVMGAGTAYWMYVAPGATGDATVTVCTLVGEASTATGVNTYACTYDRSKTQGAAAAGDLAAWRAGTGHASDITSGSAGYHLPASTGATDGGKIPVLNAGGTAWGLSSGSGSVTGSGIAGAIAYWASASGLTGSASLVYDAINTRVGLGVAGPATLLDLAGSSSNSSLKIGYIELQSYDASNIWITRNAYNASGTWKYRATGTASLFYISDSFLFYTASSGSAGTTPTWTDRFYIKNTGYVGIGTTSPQAKLHISAGQILTTGNQYGYGWWDGDTISSYAWGNGGETATGDFYVNTYRSLTWSERIRIVNATGNFLIGTATDGTARLVVKSDGTNPTQKWANSAGTVTATMDKDGILQTSGYKSSDGSAGYTGTVALAKLTAGGANGSLTVKNGLITAYAAPT